MRESVLRDYFLGLVDELCLSEDLASSVVQTSYDVINYYLSNNLTEDFDVKPSHLIKLCDVVIAGKLDAKNLETIGFAMIASEHFMWDGSDSESGGELIADVLHDWASPEINYPLTIENIVKFRHLLLTGKDTFTKEDVTK